MSSKWPILFLILFVLVDVFFSVRALSHAMVYFPFAGSIVTTAFVLAIRYFTARLKTRADQSWEVLANLKPTQARRVVKAQETLISVEELVPGDVCSVLSGELIPCDGIILSGATSVDESRMTGEKTILLKVKGDKVAGGALNRDSTILIRMDIPLAEQFLPRMQSLATQSLKAAPKSQLYLEIIWQVSWIMLWVAVLAFGLKTPFLPVVADRLIVWGIALLALLLFWGEVLRFIPHIVMMGVGHTLSLGVLISQASTFKKLSQLSYLFFDKTGTLSKGEFFFSQFYQERGANQGRLLATFFSLQNGLTNPLARGMQSHPWYAEVPKYEVGDRKTESGLGVSGVIKAPGKQPFLAVVGNQRYLKRQGMQLSRDMRHKIDELEAMGETVVLCGWDREVHGLMSFVDNLRHDVRDVLTSLGSLKIKPIMITGDHAEMMANLNYTRGLKEVYTRCLPEEKAKKISLQKSGGAMVGLVGTPEDFGPAFVQADIGVTVGAGTSLTPELKAVTILGRNLMKVVELIGYSRKVYGGLRHTMLLNFALLVVCASLSLTGVIHPYFTLPLMAVAVMLESKRLVNLA